MIFPSRYLEWMTIKLFGWVDECGSAGTAGKAMTKPQDTNSTESHHSDLKQLRCPSGLRGTTQVRVAAEPAAGEKNPTRSTFFMPLLCSLNDPAHLIASSSSCTLHRLALFFCYPSSSSSPSLFSAFPTSRCALRGARRGPARQMAPLLFFFIFFLILHTRAPLKRKEKGEKKEKKGGVGGLPPTLKLFSPSIPTIRQHHSHTETQRREE